MQRQMRLGAALLMLLALSGCASVKYVHPAFNAEQRRYLDSAAKQPLTFELDKAASDAAWSRAQVILAHVSPLKLQLVSDSVLFTYNDQANYAWQVTREDRGKTSLFDVACFTYERGEHDCQKIKVTDRNARAVAWFIASGERMPDGLVWPALKRYDAVEETTFNPFLWGEVNDKWGDFECEGKPLAPLPLPAVTAGPAPAPAVALNSQALVFSNKIAGGRVLIQPVVANPAQAQSWTLTIYGPGSPRQVVRSLGGNAPVPESLEWDGRDSAGIPAPEGVYPAVLQVQYRTGQRITSSEIRLEINNRFPDLSWERTTASQDHRRPAMLVMPAEFKVDATFSRLPCRWRMEIRWTDGSLVRTLEGAVTPGLKIVWEGKDERGQAFISNTRYRFKLTLLDALNNPVKEYPERIWNCVFRE